jgi:hypothetical protein
MVGARLAALLLFTALPAPAQTVRGLLTDSVSRSPLPGAFLTLVDDKGVERARVMTNQAGEFVVTAPAAGSYRLRSKRIGFRPLLSAPLTLRAGEAISYNGAIDPIPIPLQAVVVAGERQCDVESDASTAALWDEVREALAAVSWTSRVPAYWYDFAMFKRELTAGGRRKGDDSTWGRTAFSMNPIRNFTTSDELATQGYVVVTDTAGWIYRAPDPDVLLSPSFLRTHCFETQTSKGDNAGLVGLGFTSARDRTVPEITGTLWVDRANSELRALDFKYIRLPQDLVSSGAGGHIAFLRLPSGVWIIRDWWIRMPRSQVKQRPMAMGEQLEVVGFVEMGGSARTIKTRSGTLVYGTQDVASAGPPSTVPPPAPPAIDPSSGAPAPAGAAVPGPAASTADTTRAQPASHPRIRNSNLIDREEVESSTAIDAYALVQQARPNWLHQRGAISLRDPTAGVVQVYLDGQQYGEVSRLREINTQDVRELRFLGAGEAQMRYGVGHAGGVIEVYTGVGAPTERIASGPSAAPLPAPPPPPPALPVADSTRRQMRVRNPNVLREEEFSGTTAVDGMALVMELRPNWLRSRGAVSIQDPNAGDLQVYINGVHAGDLNRLREVSIISIRELRFLGAGEAQQRYGVGHAGGVIEVVLK